MPLSPFHHTFIAISSKLFMRTNGIMHLQHVLQLTPFSVSHVQPATEETAKQHNFFSFLAFQSCPNISSSLKFNKEIYYKKIKYLFGDFLTFPTNQNKMFLTIILLIYPSISLADPELFRRVLHEPIEVENHPVSALSVHFHPLSSSEHKTISRNLNEQNITHDSFNSTTIPFPHTTILLSALGKHWEFKAPLEHSYLNDINVKVIHENRTEQRKAKANFYSSKGEHSWTQIIIPHENKNAPHIFHYIKSENELYVFLPHKENKGQHIAFKGSDLKKKKMNEMRTSKSSMRQMLNSNYTGSPYDIANRPFSEGVGVGARTVSIMGMTTMLAVFHVVIHAMGMGH